MKNISTTQKITITIILFMVVALFGYVQLYKYVRSQQEKLVTLEQELHSVDVVSESQQEVRHFLDETASDREEFNKYFVSIEDPTPFLEQIDMIAQTASTAVEVSELDMKYVDDDKLLSKYPKELQKEVQLILSVEGEWSEVYHFLVLLEQLPYALSILNVAFSLENEEMLGGLLKGKVHLVAHTI